MRVLVDENIPGITVRALLEAGHDVKDVRGTPEKGVVDDELWRICLEEQRLIISTDKGFLFRKSEAHSGILIVRLRQPNRRRIHERIMKALSQYGSDDWDGLTVVMRDEVKSTWRNERD